MDYICLDTETTGFSFAEGDKVVEIGCVKIKNDEIVAKFHKYINPKRSIPESATRVHNIKDDDVKNCGDFASICQELIEFVEDYKIVAHNAKFDLSFVNGELGNAGHKILEKERWIDSLLISKKIFPGEKANLDSLAQKLGVDNKNRDKMGHGALLDAEVLASVFMKIIQNYGELYLENKKVEINKNTNVLEARQIYTITETEMTLHNEIMEMLK